MIWAAVLAANLRDAALEVMRGKNLMLLLGVFGLLPPGWDPPMS